MKNILIILLLACCTLLGACKKSDTFTSNTMSAKINGIPWAGATFSNSINHDNGIDHIEIRCSDTTGRLISLRINNFKAVGNYNVPQPNDSAFYSSVLNLSTAYSIASTGFITILSASNSSVSGTFTFTADSAYVTNGFFSISY